MRAGTCGGPRRGPWESAARWRSCPTSRSYSSTKRIRWLVKRWRKRLSASKAGHSVALGDRSPVMSQEEFRLLRDLIYDHCGIYFRDEMRYLIERRLWPRLRLHELQ